MSFTSTLILAWAAVHSYVGIFYGILHLRRRRDREYLAFSVFSFGMAVYCLGQSLLTDATSVAEGTIANRVGYVGITVASGALVDLCMLLIGRGQSRAVTLAYAWSAIGLCANLAGLFFDPIQPVDYGPDGYREPQLLVPGLVWVVVGCGVTGWALLQVTRWVRIDADLRTLVAAAALSLFAAIHDVVVHVYTAPRMYLLEHASVLTVFAISYLLLRRFTQAGDELTRRTQELRRSYEDLRAMQEELVRKEQLAAVGELSAVIAHEVRNPLAIMKNAVSGLRRSSLGTDDRRTLLQILDEEADRLNRLVHDLLAYARPVAPKGDPVDVAEMVHSSLGASRAGTDHPELEVDLELDGPATVHCDRDLLGRALTNVIENALQAMPAGGVLSIQSRPATLNGRLALMLSVRDTGEGMDTLVRSKARDPFFTTRPAGTGLGLAIVERVIGAHGGELRIDSRYGSGTSVSIVLPIERPSSLPDAP